MAFPHRLLAGLLTFLARRRATWIFSCVTSSRGRRSDLLMSPIAAGLTRDEMRELSDYFARQKPPVQPFVADEA